jgi:hypothetical protein
LCLNFDHHQYAPYENLYTNIDTGKSNRVWASIGEGRFTQSAARSTFWNIQADQALPVPKLGFGPQLNFIGLVMAPIPETESKKSAGKTDKWRSIAPLWKAHFVDVSKDEWKTKTSITCDFDITPESPYGMHQWYEPIDPDAIWPRNLYEAQLATRLGK